MAIVSRTVEHNRKGGFVYVWRVLGIPILSIEM